METLAASRPDSAEPLDLPAGYGIERLSVCASTNDLAKERAGAGAPEGTVVWALRQTGGRGRRGRVWSSPVGNLYFSLVLRPGLPAAAAAQVSFVAAVAVAEAVSAQVPGRVTLKWPNDVLVDGAKVSGLLLESERGEGEAVDWLVLGIGINVAAHPDDTAFPATSLRACGAGDLELEAILADVLRRFDLWYRRWRTQGFAPVRAAWLNAAHGFGETVRVRLAESEFQGRFVDLDDTGALLVDVDGTIRLVTAGDVYF